MKAALLLLALGLGTTVSAQKASDIIEKYYNKIGGRDKWAIVEKDRFMKLGTENRMFMQTVIREYHDPELGYSKESMTDRGLFVTTTSWNKETFKTTMTNDEIKAEEVTYEPRDRKKFSLKPELLYYVDDLNDLVFEKKVNLDGVDFYVLQTRNQKPQVSAYFDVETSVLMIIKQGRQFIISFSDFRTLDNTVLFPMDRKLISFDTEDGVYDTEEDDEVVQVETNISYSMVSRFKKHDYLFTSEGSLDLVSVRRSSSGAVITTESILEDYRKAVGGDNWNKVNTIKYSEKGLFYNLTMQTYKQQNKGYRTEVDFGGMSSIMVVHPEGGFRKQGGKRQEFGVSAYDLNQYIEIRDDLLATEKKDIKLEYVEDEYVRGKRTNKFKGTFSNGVVKYYFIDINSHLLRRVITEYNINGNKQYRFIDFDDYKKLAEGIMFPHTRYSPENGETFITDVKINQPIDAALFK